MIRTRKEEHLDTGNRPGSMQYMRIGVGRDGKMRGGKIATWGSVGPTGGGQASAGGGGGGGVRNPSRYNFGTIAKVHEDVSAQWRLSAGDASHRPSAGDVRHRADDGSHGGDRSAWIRWNFGC